MVQWAVSVFSAFADADGDILQQDKQLLMVIKLP
jgi:hypothetical protein